MLCNHRHFSDGNQRFLLMNRFINILQRESTLTRDLECGEMFSPYDPSKLESALFRPTCNDAYLYTAIQDVDVSVPGMAKVRPPSKLPSVEG
jgi:hypothetical protein